MYIIYSNLLDSLNIKLKYLQNRRTSTLKNLKIDKKYSQ